ncbi:MAG: hypothetical protein F6K10_28110 [Moorea sp. SIO2B7]|nr:hypothetical protein [Moorena sp. SIO2B7]
MAQVIKKKREQISYAGLPLAVYREVAAHLRQVEGVETGLIPQQVEQFDYKQSQVSGLWIEYADNLDAHKKGHLQDILDYYAGIYGTWRREQIEA